MFFLNYDGIRLDTNVIHAVPKNEQKEDVKAEHWVRVFEYSLQVNDWVEVTIIFLMLDHLSQTM